MISIEEYVSTLKGRDGVSVAKPDTQRKATKAITDFKEYLSLRGKTIPDESDIEAYRIEREATDGSKDKAATGTKISYIRSYYALNEERSKTQPMTEEKTLGANEPESVQASEENSQVIDVEAITENEPESLPEPVKARKRSKNGEKKVPVSVYLDGETYRVINTLSGLTHRTIGDIAASTLSEFAKKNAAKIDAKAAEVQQALEAVKKAMANFTLEY